MATTIKEPPQRDIRVPVPKSPEKVKRLGLVLAEENLISRQEANRIQREANIAKLTEKTRWQLAAERLRSEGFLDGHSDEVKELLQECRVAL